MDFIKFINEQSFKLLSNDYVDHLWKILNSETTNIKPSSLANLEKDYRNHLPVDLEGFLQTCVDMVVVCLKDNTPPDWVSLDHIYYNTFVYWSLQQRSEVDVLVPLLAARLYFLLNLLEKREKNINFELSYCETLNVINHLRCINFENDAFVRLLRDFNCFIEKGHVGEKCLKETINTLFNLATCGINVAFLNFSVSSSITSRNYLAFVCLKTLFTSICDKTFVVSYLLNKHNSLCSSFANNNFLIRNIESLLCDLKDHLNNEILLALKSLCEMEEYSDYDHLIPVINSLDYDDYIDFCHYLLEMLRQCDKDLEHVRQRFGKVGISIMKSPHPKVDENKRLIYLGFLLDTYFSLLIDDSKEMACFFIDKILSIDDVEVKNAILVFLNRDINHNVNILSILEVLQTPIDILWRKSNYNILYINIICKLSFIKPQILFTGSVLDVVEKLCLEASPTDLKPSAENLSSVMVKNYNQPLVVEKMLNVLVHFALMPVTASSFYCKLLSKSILQPILNKSNTEVGIEIANILISNNYDYENVFEKLNTSYPIKNTLFSLLLNGQVAVNRKAWKLLCPLCNLPNFHPDVKDVSTLMNHMDEILEDKDYNTVNAVLFVSYKVLKQKPTLNSNQTKNLQNMRKKVEKLIAEHEFPVQCVTNTIAFLKFSAVLTKDDDNVELFKTLQNKLLPEINSVAVAQSIDGPLFQRNAIYYANMCLLYNVTVNNEILKLLETILEDSPVKFKDFFDEFPWIWTSCLAMYTAICVKNKTAVGDITNRIFQHTFSAEDVNVNIHGVNYYYDLCNLYLDNFNNLITNIFRLIDKRDSYFTVHCVKIIERLVLRDYVRLTEIQFLKLVSLFSQENYHVNEAIKYILRQNFIAKTHQFIASSFVNGIIHYNCFKGHPKYSIFSENSLDIALTKHRRHIVYKYLFSALPKQKQFNVLSEISTEILAPLLNNEVKFTWDVITDSLSIYLMFTCQHNQVKIENRKEHYENCIKDVVTIISMKNAANIKATPFSEFHNEMEVILKKILCLPYYILNENENLYTDVVEVVFSVIQCFLNDIKNMTLHSNHTLVKLLRSFCSIYKKNMNKIDYENKNQYSFQQFQQNVCAYSTPSKQSSSSLMTFDLNL